MMTAVDDTTDTQIRSIKLFNLLLRFCDRLNISVVCVAQWSFERLSPHATMRYYSSVFLVLSIVSACIIYNVPVVAYTHVHIHAYTHARTHIRTHTHNTRAQKRTFIVSLLVLRFVLIRIARVGK